MTIARPSLLDEVGDLQVLLLERRRRVEHEDDDLGEADGAERIGDRELLELALDPRLAPQPGGVEQPERACRATSSRWRWSRA